MRPEAEYSYRFVWLVLSKSLHDAHSRIWWSSLPPVSSLEIVSSLLVDWLFLGFFWFPNLDHFRGLLFSYQLDCWFCWFYWSSSHSFVRFRGQFLQFVYIILVISFIECIIFMPITLFPFAKYSVQSCMFFCFFGKSSILGFSGE